MQDLWSPEWLTATNWFLYTYCHVIAWTLILYPKVGYTFGLWSTNEAVSSSEHVWRVSFPTWLCSSIVTKLYLTLHSEWLKATLNGVYKALPLDRYHNPFSRLFLFLLGNCRFLNLLVQRIVKSSVVGAARHNPCPCRCTREPVQLLLSASDLLLLIACLTRKRVPTRNSILGLET